MGGVSKQKRLLILLDQPSFYCYFYGELGLFTNRGQAIYRDEGVENPYQKYREISIQLSDAVTFVIVKLIVDWLTSGGKETDPYIEQLLKFAQNVIKREEELYCNLQIGWHASVVSESCNLVGLDAKGVRTVSVRVGRRKRYSYDC